MRDVRFRRAVSHPLPRVCLIDKRSDLLQVVCHGLERFMDVPLVRQAGLLLREE